MIDKLKNSKFFQHEKYYIWATLVFLLAQWFIIGITNVNIPAGDEWESLNADALPKGFSWEYVFSFLNEHRGVFTRLQNYFFFKFTDWNMSYQIHWNYIVFSCLVIFLIWFQKKYIVGSTKGIWFLTFFLASPILVDNHNWAIQSFFHYCELFGILAIYFATREIVSIRDYWFSALLAVFSTYSFAAGMFFATVVVLVLAVRLWLEKATSLQNKYTKAFPILLLIVGMGSWFIGYHKNPGHPPFVWPYEWEFWYFFSNLISLGFGFKTSNAVVALIALGIVTVVMWKSLKSAFSFRQQYVSFAFFCSLAVLGALTSIALSRVGFGIGQSKISRYAELSILFVPCIGWLWWHLGIHSLKFEKYHKYLGWFICLGFSGNYSYSVYFRVHRERTESVECIASYYRGENKTGDCPILYPVPIGERLDRAKHLKLSWVPEVPQN